ncbi:hypothetical protein A2U01_0015231 [Trifolium medium]|uniref:Uncharacterized protein n=1 Tax=Trifolium medium TaxID=97028 RepID=A0A392N702_9FABA|nr:hypothetical protein [Trifolium medium]
MSPSSSNPVGSSTQGNLSDFRSPPRPFQLPRDPPFGMPTTMMANLHNFQHIENPNAGFSPSASVNQVPVQNLPMPNNPGVPLIQGQQQVVAQEEPSAQVMVEPNPGIVLVNRNQNADEVVRNVQQNNLTGQNNLAHLVETILAQNGLNMSLCRPNFVSVLSEYVLQTELPSG